MSKHEESGPIQFDAEGKRVEFDKDGKPKTPPAGPSGQPIDASGEVIPVGPDGKPLPYPAEDESVIPQRPQDEAPGGDLKNPAPAQEPPVANPAKGNAKPR